MLLFLPFLLQYNWLWCVCTCMLWTNWKEKALPSWSSFKQANPLPQNMIWIKPFRPPLILGMYVWISSHQRHMLYLCYIIPFPQTVLTLQNNKSFVFSCKPTQPPLLPLRWSEWLTEHVKRQACKMRRLCFCHRSEPSHNHRENEWKALFTGLLLFWQASSHRASSICQYLISVGVNWRETFFSNTKSTPNLMIVEE